MAEQRAPVVTRRRLLQTTVGGAAILALSACLLQTQTQTQSQAPVQTAGASSAAAAKDTWTVALDFNIPAFDFATSGEWRGITGHVYESLVDTVGADFKLVPRLAERWEQKDDQTLRFYLRKGVKFHNGEEVKAEDVKYSLDLYAVPDRPYPYIEW